jgi:DNA-binding transcriptional MerR regulator
MDKNKLIGISELAQKLNLIDKKSKKLSTHTLRFWEKEFKEIKPIKFIGNRRYYDKKNIELIKLIQFLLKKQGLTINGAKKILNKNVNSLDDYQSSSIKVKYFKDNIKQKTKVILNRINKIKNG